MAGEGAHENDPTVGRILTALERIAPAHVLVGVRRITTIDIGDLHADEAFTIRNAVPKRRREFASGRRLLHDLLGTNAAILPGATRAPIWPPGVRGTLAHDDVYAIAAITRHDSIAALGIDIEPATELAADVAELIRRPEELAIDAHLAFTLKEAAYKAWSALGGRILDHQDVVVEVDGERFQAEVVPDGTILDGAVTKSVGRWLAVAVARRGDRGR